MDRRRAAGLLLALAACFATATAAPTASNHTALDLYDGAPEGCYYNFQHYGEGDRIMTNEPCLNCTCHNRMLMCYLRVCPFTKPIGQDCTIEKRADQCCPIVTCPDVPVDLLTSTTTSPAEYGPTGMGKLDKYGCSINGKYFSEGSKVPPTPNKPCEHCYCIRNMTTCVMQECTLHVDGCTPIYHKDVCCPVRYSCDHPEDEMPLLDDLSTTVRPTPGFLLTTTTISPVTQMSQDCVYDNRVFPDGALIKTEKACDHCYCMKGDIVCVVQECGTPMENEGKNCTALLPREGVCCPDTYICEGDEPSTETYETDELTTPAGPEKHTTLLPPRRTSSEGSGYRNEPDEGPYTESSILEPEIEGSGETEEPKQPDIASEKPKPESTDDILASTEETHEFIPLTTTKPKEEEEETRTEVSKEDENIISSGDIEKTTESQQRLPSTTDFYSTKDVEEPITDRTEDIGSGELPEDMGLKPHDESSVKPVLPDTQENVATTEINEQNIITSGFTEQEPTEPQSITTNAPLLKEEITDKPSEQVSGINEVHDMTTSISTNQHDITTASIPIVEEGTKSPDFIKPSQTSEETTEESTTKDLEFSTLTTLRTPIIEEEVQETTKSTERDPSATDDFIKEGHLETQKYPSSTSVSNIDDDFVTTEAPEPATDKIKESEFFEPQHVTASTPMLEEIEKDTTEYTESELVIPSGATQDVTSNILSTTISDVPAKGQDQDVTESTIFEDNIPDKNLPGTTNIPVFDQQEQTTTTHEKIPEAHIDTDVKESSKPEDDSSATTISSLIDNERKTTLNLGTSVAEYDGSSTTASVSETEEATTEPDKGLNTIPSEGIDKEVPASPEVQKSTTTEEKITTEADLANKLTTEAGDITSPTISDTSVSREEQLSSTTESAFRKEDYSPTEAQISPESTTVTASVTGEVISTLTHDHTKSTESVPSLQHETFTTLEPKYTESIEDTTLAKDISDVSTHEFFTSEASVSEIITEKPTTSIPLHEEETTTANQEDNEIFNEPRIPGEGDCLVNGVTYTNESAVPSTNKCQSGCKCVSSIIKCDPIICSPPPEYMDNCETMYDTLDACCPTYICDHKTETIPPQSHSQMSGTEAPVISPVDCHGAECEINKDQKHHDKTTDACKSGSCESPSDESKETTGYVHPEMIPEKPLIVQNEECVGDECKQVLCTSENGCQATPVQPCEGDQCDISPDVIIPPETQQCAQGEDCTVSSIPAKECIGDKCDTSSTQLESTHPTEICTEKEGCLNIPQLPEDECNEDHCRRKDSSPLDQHISEPCTAPDCKQTQKDIENTVAPSLEQTSQSIDEESKKEIAETTEKLESVTEFLEYPSSGVTSGPSETSGIVTKQPEIKQEESLTNVPDIIELVTKHEPETTTKAGEHTDEQEITIGDFVTEKKEPLFTESPEYQSSGPTDATKKDSDEDVRPTVGDGEVEMTDMSITQTEKIDTELPQEFITTEKLTSAETSDVTEPPKVPPEIQETKEPAEKIKPETETSVFSEGSSTEPSVPVTVESYKTTKPSIDIIDEISTDIVIDGSTEPSKTPDDMNKLDIPEDKTIITLIKESTTEPSSTFSTELEKTEQTKSTSTIEDIKLTDLPLKATEPTIIDTNEQIGETEHTKITSEPSKYDATTVSVITDDLQSITVSKSPEEIEHKDTPPETDESATEPSKSYVTDSLETTKSSESFDQEDSTQKMLDGISTEPSLHYTEEQHEIVSQESEKTTTEIYERITEPSETQIDTQSVTKSPEEIERISVPATETTESYATESKVPENIYHEETTPKISEDTSSEPSKIYDTDDQSVTQSSDRSDHKDSTSTIYDESSETSVTDIHIVPEKVDEKDTTTELPDKSGSEPINVYPFEEQEDNKQDNEEDNKSPIEIDQETSTDNVLDESVTEPPKSLDTGSDISKIPEQDTTSNIYQATDAPLSYTTLSQDTSKSPEEPIMTTVKPITESASEPSEAENEIKHELVTLKPITEGPFVETESPEDITTSQGQFTSKSDELTTPSTMSDSKITAPQEEIPKETTDTASYDIESKRPEIEGGAETESAVKEQVSTTPVPTYHDIATTTTPLSSESDQTKDGESTTKAEPQKSDTETQTISSTTSPLEEISQSDLQTTKQPEIENAGMKDVSQQTDTGTQETFAPTESDELRTTSSFEMYDLTTLKSIEVSQLPHDIEIKTDHPETSFTPQKEQNTENIFDVAPTTSSGEISAGTEKLVIPETISTDKPITTENSDFTKEIESETEPSQISSESKPSIQESYTEESVSKYSSPSSAESSTGYDDSTKAYLDQNTVEPIYHDTKETGKPVDGLIQSLVTEQYEIDTKPSDIEKDSQTETSTQISSATPEDVKKVTQLDNARDELSTPSSISADTTLGGKVVLSTEYEKPVDQDTRTESPPKVDQVEDETTTQKKPEDGAVTQEPSSPEDNEIVTSKPTEHKSTTERTGTLAFDITTEAISQDMFITEKQELSPSDEPSVDLHVKPTEASYTTETSEKHTESAVEITKLPDVQIQTETSEAVTEGSHETQSDIEKTTPKPVSEELDSTSEDQRTTEISEPGKIPSELTTIGPSTDHKIPSQFEPTTVQDYPEGPSSTSEEIAQTDKIEESTKPSSAGEFTTESPSSDRFTEKQPEIVQTVTPEKATPVVEYVTTRKHLEPEVYQTTTSVIETINELSTRPSVSPEDSSTTMVHDVEEKPASEEQSIPVIISETEKTTPEESFAVQTERVVPASEKPIQETTAPEEEFIIATSKATTASPSADTTSKPMDSLAESYSTTTANAYITEASESPVSTLSEAPIKMTPDTFVTSIPESPVTKAPEVPVTTEAEALVTKITEEPVTIEPEVPATNAFEESATTNASEAPFTSAPEVPEASITNAPETPIIITPEAPKVAITDAPEVPLTSTPEALITNAPETPVTTAPEAEVPITDVPEAQITSASEAPEAPMTSAPESTITNAPEVPEGPISSAPEAPITNAPEAPTPSAPEEYITKTPEIPISSAPEAPITDAPITKAPDAPITNAPEAPVTSAPESSATTAPELPKPVSTEAQPTDEIPTPDEEGSFPPSGGTSGYGQEPDYVEEDQTFGPGTCRYGGKVYVSAQQIPRDDPCDFCFCFRSDIICLQQSCPPPIHGCHEEPIQGFCCPRYECPVSMATTVNVTTTTTTTTTTLPPHFPTHSYKGSVQKRGCQIKGQTYKVGEVVRASSGPCLHCTCGGDGQMKCDPKVCTPEPMLRQMIAAAVSAKRRR